MGSLAVRARRSAIRLVAGVAVLGFLAPACGADEPDATTPDGAYARVCASCHGADAQGTAAGPPLAGVTEAQVRQAVTEGVATDAWPFPGMPAVVGVSDEQLELIVAHLTQG